MPLDDLTVVVTDHTPSNGPTLNNPSPTWSSPVKRARSAYDQSILFVRAPNPRSPTHLPTGVQVAVSILDGNGTPSDCEMLCVVDSVVRRGVEEKCNGEITLHEREELSQEKVFT